MKINEFIHVQFPSRQFRDVNSRVEALFAVNSALSNSYSPLSSPFTLPLIKMGVRNRGLIIFATSAGFRERARARARAAGENYSNFHLYGPRAHAAERLRRGAR